MFFTAFDSLQREFLFLCRIEVAGVVLNHVDVEILFTADRHEEAHERTHGVCKQRGAQCLVVA